MTYLAHELHPYVEMPEMHATDNGPPLCICGLARTHHMHVGISSAVCTCMGCIRTRDPDDPYPGHAATATHGADSPAEPRTGVPRHTDATREAGEAQEAAE